MIEKSIFKDGANKNLTHPISKQGISLIVLIITIIVMIILAAAIILSLNNSNIIDKANEAVESTDLAQVKHLATLKWSEAYLDEKLRDKEELATFVLRELAEEVDLSEYRITVTEAGVDVEMNPVPIDWRENVVDIVDTVPIPKGFIASPYNGENLKNGGLVIYELNEGETTLPSTETQHTSWTTRNQYVWVPVEKETFVTTFVRTVGNNGVLGSNSYWEVIVDEETNLPLTTLEEQGAGYMSEATLAEVQAMYASVKEYGGFYIARYEAGIDTKRANSSATLVTGNNVHSKMGKIPYNHISWSTSSEKNVDTGAAVEVARGLYPVNDETNTTGVVSTLTYGVQWDRVLSWWQELDPNLSVESSTDYGNYGAHIIESAADLNDGAQVAIYDSVRLVVGSYVEKDNATLTYPKASGTKWVLSTGALKAANVNNIYDMAGNIEEWTMEGCMNYRVSRGGKVMDGNYSVAERYYSVFTNGFRNNGFRPCLYIKQ